MLPATAAEPCKTHASDVEACSRGPGMDIAPAAVKGAEGARA